MSPALGATGLGAMAIACALMAGVYFAFSTFIMSSLEAVPSAEGIAAMQSINRAILKSAFMPLFFLTSVAGLGLGMWGLTRWGEPSAPFLAAGGVIYFAGMLGVTAAFNVPLNNALDAVDPKELASLEVWSDYLRDWTRWNHVRTLSSATASVLFLAAARTLS